MLLLLEEPTYIPEPLHIVILLESTVLFFEQDSAIPSWQVCTMLFFVNNVVVRFVETNSVTSFYNVVSHYFVVF